MNSVSFFFLIVLVIVVLCIVVRKIKDAEAEREAETLLYEMEKRKSSTVSPSHETTKPPEKTHSGIIRGPKHEKPQEEGPPQITIYAYHSTGNSKICAICDGENDKAASQCRICGNRLY